MKIAEGVTTIIALVGAIAGMLAGLYIVFDRLKFKQQGFGPNSLKALGLVLFLPTLVFVSSLKNFTGETIAALLGTVAGYVLSHSKGEE